MEITFFNEREIFSLLRKKILPAGKKNFLGRQKKICRPAKFDAKIETALRKNKSRLDTEPCQNLTMESLSSLF